MPGSVDALIGSFLTQNPVCENTCGFFRGFGVLVMKVKKYLGVCLDGYPFVAVFLVIALLSFFFKSYWVAIPFGILTLWCIWFFRDPERQFEGGEHVLVSPADGKIIEIKEVDYPYLIQGRALKVSIFMNIFNVHVNRFPLSGTVLETKYFEGSFMGAFKEKASLENEQMGVLIDHKGTSILFIQIAGLIARRIICRVKKGDTLARGERFGLIRFGSRVDVYLPLNSKIAVNIGQKVFAGHTKLGEV